MKAGKGGGGLLGLLARYILGLALTLLALAGLALLVWDGEMNRLFYPPDWDGLLADPALAQERYTALAPYLRDTGEIAVYNGDGSLAWASDDDFDPSLTTSELGCIPLQGSSSRIDCYPYLDTAGGNRTLLVRTDFGNAGEQSRAMVLDGSGRVVWGGFGDGRAQYTERELSYLTGERFAGWYLTAARLNSGQVVLLRERLVAGESYLAQYAAAQRRMWGFVPLFLAAAVLWVLLLRRRIARPLRRLDAAVTAQAAGRPVRVGDCGGPREIRQIGARFDRYARQLEESEAERRRLDEARGKMIAAISHDIKTPVTVICGGIDAVCDGKVPPEEIEPTLRMIRRRADTLAQLADSFHEYAKVEHPDFLLHPERTDIGEFVREYLAAKYDEIALAGFTLEANLPETPLCCKVDRLQLTRALDNLLSNALRHNRLGTALFVDAAREEGWVTIRIADNGEGIPPSRRARIFEPFVTGNDARSTSGSGLGLSIARQILERQGGTLTLTPHPVPPRVTEFVLTLPCAE